MIWARVPVATENLNQSTSVAEPMVPLSQTFLALAGMAVEHDPGASAAATAAGRPTEVTSSAASTASRARDLEVRLPREAMGCTSCCESRRS